MYLKAPNVKSHCFYFPTSRKWVIFLNKFRFKNWAPSIGHNIFKAAHISNLKNVSSTAFSMRFILVPVWGKVPFPQSGTKMKRVGFYAKFNVEVYHHHGTSHQDSCGTRKAFSSPPGRSSFSWITTLCTLQKDLSLLLPNLPRKVHFWIHDWHVAFCWLYHFSFKRVQWGPSVPTAMIASCVSTNDCVHCKKTDHCCSQSRWEKSFLECARRILSAVSFSLQTSTKMAIHAYRKRVGHLPTPNGKCWVSSIRIALAMTWKQAKLHFGPQD
jgi:hypothetical protein